MANEKQAETPAKKEVIKLVAPEVVTLVGTVVSLTEREKGGKFKHDTKIVTVEELGTGETHDVFITANQWKEYGCKPLIYGGNIVTFSLEDCIEGKTGYKEFEESVELTPHEQSFKSFGRVVETSTIKVLTELNKAGVEPSMCKMIVDDLNTTRRYSKSMNL